MIVATSKNGDSSTSSGREDARPRTGENCRTGCRTRDHESYGQCLRDANPRVTLMATRNNPIDKNYDAYKAVRAEGIQPDTTKPEDIEVAKAFSDRTGVAYDAGRKSETLLKAGGFDA